MSNQNFLPLQFPITSIPAGKKSFYRRNHFITVFRQCFQVVLHDRIMEHVHIHSGSNQLFTGACQCRCRQHIIGNPVCQLSNNIRRGWCNQQDICFFRQRNMRHMELEIPVKRIDHTFVSRQRFKCDWCDKLGSIWSQYDVYITSHFYKHTRHIRHLISRNAPCNAQNNSFSLQHMQSPFCDSCVYYCLHYSKPFPFRLEIS